MLFLISSLGSWIPQNKNKKWKVGKSTDYETAIVATSYIQVGSSYEELQAQLDEAVRSENYGAAAVLRDQMRY